MAQPISIHPENPKLFLYRDKPLMLLTPTEHYGAVMNRPFRYELYLKDVAEKGITFSRLFLLFRELQTPNNPYSTCKPESPEYVAPYLRVPPERALDAQFKYDLDQWNPEFFERLHGFLALAQEYGIIIEVVFFSNTYVESLWELNPLHHKNNLNDLEAIPWYEHTTLRHAKRFARHQEFVRKIVRELNAYDNILYEICNEPAGNVQVENAPPPAEVDDWLNALIALVREEEAKLPNQHLIAGQESNRYPEEAGMDMLQVAEKAFRTMDYDVVNTHALSRMQYKDTVYNLGWFMNAELNLATFRDYTLAIYFGESKPLCHDEDNCASQLKNELGWTLHRKRAWTALFCGAHYDYIDFSINNYQECGTEASNRCIRTWFKHLSGYIHGLDLIRTRPLQDVVNECPAHCVASVMGMPGDCYHVYLADAREQLDPGYGGEMQGILNLNVDAGNYTVDVFHPITGETENKPPFITEGDVTLEVGPFIHDIVIRLRKEF